jgi:glycerophosphoryl diester phosphodiesterase
MLELKQPWPESGRAPDGGLADAALEVIRRYGLLARTVFISFHHPSLAALLERAPDAAVGLLFSRDPPMFSVSGAAGLHPRWTWITPELCASAHARGAYVHAWGMPEPLDPRLVRGLVADGVDSLSANDPRALVTLVR